MSTGITHAIGTMPMITKVTRGVMRRNVDYTSCVIAYLEVSYGAKSTPLLQLVRTTHTHVQHTCVHDMFPLVFQCTM